MTFIGPKQFCIHMIGNAHLDPVWLWDWREGRDEAIRTCWAAVERLGETEDYVFTRSSAAVYEWIEESAPELWAAIQHYVAKGQWNIVGGWWVQPDCNIPCGESFVRQALYGKRYFQEKLGVDVGVGYNVDSFGHAGCLPQILKKAGFDYYVHCRPEPKEKYLPSPIYWWQGIDGSRVLTFRPSGYYVSGPGNLDGKIYLAFYTLTSCTTAEPQLRDIMCFYGPGDHGGGPTRENIAAIKAADANPQLPAVKFSSCERFFKTVSRQGIDFPVVADELQHHSVGCYTSLSMVKRYNRRCEMALMTAERFSALAQRMLGRKYRARELSKAWRKVLFNQFHDILPGTSIARAYEDVYAWYEQALRIAEETTSATVYALATDIDTSGAADPVVVFNPLCWPRREVVHASANESFVADLPALGWCVYDRSALPVSSAGGVGASTGHLENELVRAEFGVDGTLTSLQDKRTGVEMLSDLGNRFIVINDPSDTWGHGVDSYRDEIGVFSVAQQPQVIHESPLQATLRFHLHWDNSTATVDVTLTAISPRLDFELNLDWHQHNQLLKVAFPVNIDEPQAVYETPYAAITRHPNGHEEPGQRWIDVSGQHKGSTMGLALLNDCKYGFDVLDNEMRMTVTRSPIYAFHTPAGPDPNKHYEYIDQGQISVKYALLAHAGPWQQADLAREGWAFNNPPIVHWESSHSGKLLAQTALCTAEPANIVITVVKQAEDSNDLVLRLYETTGQATQAQLVLPAEQHCWDFILQPFEIKTFKVSSTGELKEADLLERPY